MQALDRAGGQEEWNCTQEELAVDFLPLMGVGARVDCKRSFRPGQEFLE